MNTLIRDPPAIGWRHMGHSLTLDPQAWHIQRCPQAEGACVAFASKQITQSPWAVVDVSCFVFVLAFSHLKQ